MATVKGLAANEIIRALMPVIILILVFYVIKKFFAGSLNILGNAGQAAGEGMDLGDKIGISKNTTQAATEKSMNQYINFYNQQPQKNPFLPSYFTQYHDKEGYKGKLTAADVKALVNAIYSSDNFVTYSPEKLTAAFMFCKAKVEVSFIALEFQKQHGSLWNFVTNYTGASRKESALLSIFRYVDKLPVGRT